MTLALAAESGERIARLRALLAERRQEAVTPFDQR
jgi:hypothetical protein